MVTVQFLGRWWTVQWMMAQFRGLICTTQKKFFVDERSQSTSSFSFERKQRKSLWPTEQAPLRSIFKEGLIVMLFGRSGVSDSLWPHGLQPGRLPCPSLSPRACSNSCPSSRWCHPIISSSVIPSSSCLQSFPASGYFPVSQLFSSSGSSIGLSATASVLPVNIQGWSPLGWTGLISLQSKGLSRVFPNTTVQNGVRLQWSAFGPKFTLFLGRSPASAWARWQFKPFPPSVGLCRGAAFALEFPSGWQRLCQDLHCVLTAPCPSLLSLLFFLRYNAPRKPLHTWLHFKVYFSLRNPPATHFMTLA